MRRVNVVGISGCGKSTFARELAARLGVPCIELDALHHGPNWTEATADELREKVEAALAATPDGWVVDGNYRNKLGSLVLGQADTLVWLEPPLRVSLARLARRTGRRYVRREELWNGNRETLANILRLHDGLFAWAIQTHARHREEIPAAVAANSHLQVFHLRTAQEAEAFMQGLTP